MEAGDRAAEGLDAASPGPRRKPLLAFIFTLAVVVVVLVMLPAAVESMVMELRGQAADHIYDLFTGQEVDVAKIVGPETAFANVTVTNLDEASRMATLTVYGNRVCEAVCPELTATFYSIGNESARRRGLPPSASITIPGETGSYTYTIELPIKGTPQRYPFDDYTILLGLVVSATLPDGTQRLIDSPELMERTVSLTLEDLVVRLNMIPPQPVDPAAVRSPSDPTEFLLVDMLQWQRPRYLRILSVLMVILISASGVFALSLRSLPELVLGIGGIILGIWGVRSVVVQSPLPDVTLIDLILGFVMLALMLVLTMRAARYFYVQSGLGRRG
jgi:hypothetical protein